MAIRKRTWIRFSLAKFLLVSLCVSTAIGVCYRTANARKRATAELLQNGFTLAYDRSEIVDVWAGCGFGARSATNKPQGKLVDSPSKHLWLSSIKLVELANSIESIDGERSWLDQKFPGFSDNDLAPIAMLAGVKELRLNYNSISDRGLKYISHLTTLQKLTLEGCQISDEGLSHLSNMRNLQHLSLSETNVSDAGLQKLKHMKDLRHLALSGTDVSGEFLKDAECWRKLQFLNLSGTNIGQKNIDRLAKFADLDELYLDETSITDLSAVLPRLQHLKFLHVNGTSLGDEFVDQLKGKNLAYLSIDRTNVSGKSIATIKAVVSDWFSGSDSKLTEEQIDAIDEHIELKTIQ